MKRETSKEAREEFKSTNTQAYCMHLILDILDRYGPLTGREICEKADQEGLWKRLSEMEKLNIIETDGKKRCSVTGKRALVWKLTKEGIDPDTDNFKAPDPDVI